MGAKNLVTKKEISQFVQVEKDATRAEKKRIHDWLMLSLSVSVVNILE